MIWSVSTLLRLSGTATPVWVVNFSICELLLGSSSVEICGAGQRAANSGRGRDRDRDQVSTSTLALAALEVAVRGRRAPLLRGELVGVHAQAHRAPRTAPLGAGLGE